MSIRNKVETIANNQQAVYDAGFAKGSESGGQGASTKAFWDNVKANSGYMVYAFSGCAWRDNTFKPIYDIVPRGNATCLFRACGITDLKKCFDDAGVTLDTSQVTNANTMFGYSASLTTVPKLDLSNATNTQWLFNACSALQTIEEINFSANTPFNETFKSCSALTNMTVTGVIGQNGLDLSASTLLSHDSLMSVINSLESKTSGTWTVTLGTTNLAKLTATEKGIATNKGWTLA